MLSTQQARVLAGLQRGQHVTEIARELNLSINTVKRRCRRIFAKTAPNEAIWRLRYLPRG
jgi:DNA-binding NarL/FixJ family response regulator